MAPMVSVTYHIDGLATVQWPAGDGQSQMVTEEFRLLRMLGYHWIIEQGARYDGVHEYAVVSKHKTKGAKKNG